MKRIAITAGLLLLAACGGDDPTPAEFFDVARQVLRFAEQDARQNQPGRVADGPLYVNVHSFRSAAHRVTGETISEDSMSRALGEPTQALQEQVLLCDTASGFGGCWVRKYGVWVNLNLMRHAGDEMTAYVRTSSTDRRSIPTTWCDRVWELDFRRQESGAWRLSGQRLRRDCTQEEQ
ncbi:MAG TPA: hypothetical protein VHG08_17380 [Longimicrobium sp.]|nr:hypothetical protein [Longimicrobium sp.]